MSDTHYDEGKTMTVQEAKIRAGKMRRAIADAVFLFEKETGLTVESIDLDHFIAHGTRRTRIGEIEISLQKNYWRDANDD